MSAEQQLFAGLDAHAGLHALVDSRIYPDGLPEGEALPAVVFARVATNPTYSIGNVLLCEDVRFAITAWAETRGAADAIAEQIRLALQAMGLLMLERSSGIDEQTGLLSSAIETELLYNP